MIRALNPVEDPGDPLTLAPPPLTGEA